MKTKVTIPRKSWTTGSGMETYEVSHNGSDVNIMPVKWSKIERSAMPKGSPNQSLRHVVFKKLGLQMNAGGNMFVPWRYTKDTGRKTFRGLSFKRISELQNKYSR